MSRKSSISAEPPDDPLEEVIRRLASIHASLAESLSTDPSVVPWVEREIDDVLRYIQAARSGASTSAREPIGPAAGDVGT